jgi:hypothetical protein
LEDSLNRVGKVAVDTIEMKKHSYFQSKENRFTGSKMLRRLSIVVPIVALTLGEPHYKYTEIHLTKRMLETAGQTGMAMVPSSE